MTISKYGISFGSVLGVFVVAGCISEVREFENVPAVELSRTYSIEKTRAKHGNRDSEKRAARLEKALLMCSADEKNTPDIDGRTPAHFFAGATDKDFLEKWVASGGRVDLRDFCNAAPLSAAVAERNMSLVRELFLAIRTDSVAVGHAMFTAISLCCYDELRLMLSLGADPNTRIVGTAFVGKSDPALFYALEQKDATAVKILLEAGANPNARGVFIKDSPDGLSALCVGIEQSPEVVEALLKAGANPNEMLREEDGAQRPILFRSFGSLSRSFAGEDASFRNAQLLVEYGAKIDAERTFPSGQTHSAASSLWLTPLDEAILQGNVPVIKYLLECGAKFSPNVGAQLLHIQNLLKRNKGENPVSIYDVPVFYKETVAYLKAMGVEPKPLPISAFDKIKNTLYRERRKPERVRELLASPEIVERERCELASFVLSQADFRDTEVFKICYACGGRVPDERLSRIIEDDDAELAEVIASAIGASGINALDADGATPLFLSVAFGSLNVFRVFLKYGGDVNGPGYEGYSILHVAECGFAAFPNSEREEILQIVKAHTVK
ncbi:MAG: hypothetical protein J6L64_06925 [Opitutales bacterium]|nr:hypothetical protein [Opitutales bacterium]